MIAPRERRNRRRLLISAITLAAVLLGAAVAQRRHRAADSFPAPEGTRSRAEVAPLAGSRPVYGQGMSRPDPLSVDPLPRETSRTPEVQAPASGNGHNDVPASLLGVIERWRSTLEKGDLETHAATYAPRVDKYFRQRRVSRQGVLREKERLLARYPHINKYEVHDVRLESIKGDRAVVTFRKDWDTSGSGSRRFAGSEKQRLTLRRLAGDWKITGEEELKVLWLRRS
jgi:hypothetical protein